MSKHTPGPWKLEYVSGICIGIGAPDKNIPGYSTMIVNTILPETDDDYDNDREQIEADARLIAAAPTMYELLKYLYMNEYCGDHGEEVQSLLNRINNV